MPDGRMEKDWQRDMLVAFTKMEGELSGVKLEIRGLRDENGRLGRKLDELQEQMHGRTRKLEHTIFGNEEETKIGLAEKVRYLESGWAKLTTGAVLLITLVIEGLKWGGHWLLQSASGGGPKVHP
jgi:hypothetical protein